MVRPATIAFAALLLAGCAHATPAPDPGAVLLAHYPACAGRMDATKDSVTCRVGGHYLTAFAATASEARKRGDLLAALLTTDTARAWVDALDPVGGQVVVIVRADG